MTHGQIKGRIAARRGVVSRQRAERSRRQKFERESHQVALGRKRTEHVAGEITRKLVRKGVPVSASMAKKLARKAITKGLRRTP